MLLLLLWLSFLSPPLLVFVVVVWCMLLHWTQRFFVWSSRCKQATKQAGAISAAAAAGFCSTGCESLLVSLFVVVFVNGFLRRLSFKQLESVWASVFCNFCVFFQEVSESSTGDIESVLWWTWNRPKRMDGVSHVKAANKQRLCVSWLVSFKMSHMHSNMFVCCLKARKHRVIWV